MKFTYALVASVFTLVAAQNSTNTSQTNISTPEAKCVADKNCNNDASCIAACYNVPNPTEDQAKKTTACAADCDKSNVDKYTICLNGCISGNFLNHPNSNGGSNNSSSGNSTKNSTESKDNNTKNGKSSSFSLSYQPVYVAMSIAASSFAAFYL